MFCVANFCLRAEVFFIYELLYRNYVSEMEVYKYHLAICGGKEEKMEKETKKLNKGLMIGLIALVAAIAVMAVLFSKYGKKPVKNDATGSQSSVVSQEQNHDSQNEDQSSELQSSGSQSSESENQTTVGSKAVTIDVINKAEEKTTYQVNTDAECLRQAMEETEGLTFSGTESDYGIMVETVNGETADYSKDKAYWAFYVNGEYCMYGIDSQPVADGDTFSIVYTAE